MSPEVSETSPWIKNIIFSSYEIEIWKQLEADGMSLSEISALTYEVSNLALNKLPAMAIENIQNMMLSQTYVAKIADESEKLDRNCNWKIKAVFPTKSDVF